MLLVPCISQILTSAGSFDVGYECIRIVRGNLCMSLRDCLSYLLTDCHLGYPFRDIHVAFTPAKLFKDMNSACGTIHFQHQFPIVVLFSYVICVRHAGLQIECKGLGPRMNLRLNQTLPIDSDINKAWPENDIPKGRDRYGNLRRW
jgi:hypothetical protein